MSYGLGTAPSVDGFGACGTRMGQVASFIIASTVRVRLGTGKSDFKSHRLLFSYAAAEVRGRKESSHQPGIELKTTMSPTRHESYTLTTEPSVRVRGWRKGK